eukprot:10736-Pyramimonas_sp.AAC.1
MATEHGSILGRDARMNLTDHVIHQRPRQTPTAHTYLSPRERSGLGVARSLKTRGSDPRMPD